MSCFAGGNHHWGVQNSCLGVSVPKSGNYVAWGPAFYSKFNFSRGDKIVLSPFLAKVLGESASTYIDHPTCGINLQGHNNIPTNF